MITFQNLNTFLKLSNITRTFEFALTFNYKKLFVKQNCLLFTCKHTSSNASVSKLYSVGPNKFAHSVFEKLPVYSMYLAPSSVGSINVEENQFLDVIKKNFTYDNVEAIYSDFETVSHYLANNSHSVCYDQITNICENIVARCEEMTDKNLLGVLCCLRLWPMPLRINLPIFTSIWNAIDEECVKRIKKWDIDKMLYVADHWYKLYLAPKTKFIWHTNLKLGRRPTRLSPHQLIQCMFYINVYQKLHPVFIKYEFEHSIEKCLDKLTLDEIGISGMMFSKTQIKIYSEDLMSEILSRIMNEVNTVHEVTLTAILLALRSSITFNLSEMLYEVLEKLKSQYPRLSLASLIHVAVSGTNKTIQVFHEDLMQSISKRLFSEMSSVRLKGLEQLSFALSQYDFLSKTNPCVYQLISKELKDPRRKEELLQFPKSLPRCLYYLSIMNVYNLDLIDYVLGEEYAKNVYGKNEFSYGLELLGLDTGLEIECQNYNGNRLSPRARERIARRYICYVPQKDRRSHSNLDKFMFDVMETLENILGGADTVYLVHILPHHERADIVFGMKENGQALNIPSEFKELSVGSIKPPPTSNCATTWYAVITGGWNLMIAKEKRPVGPLTSKIRQLKMLGYTPILLPYFEWFNLQADEKKEYLKNLVTKKELYKSVNVN